MIERYSTHDISMIWNPINRLSIFINIEKNLNDVLQEFNVIDSNGLSGVLGVLNLEELHNKAAKYEKVTKHDINAFVFAVEEMANSLMANPKDARWIHYGITSSDIVDTANAIMIRDSVFVIEKELSKLGFLFDKIAEKNRGIWISGRTHGVHAEPVKLSNIFQSFARETERNLNRLEDIKPRIFVGKLSGAVGDNKYFPAEASKEALSRLALNSESDIGQVVSRDRYAELFNTLALIGSSLEKFALQIRLLHQTGIDEIKEGFSNNQTGSSAMPHKHNPILSENVCGLSRLLKSYAAAGLQDVALWNQRDISHSSVERVILPDSFHVLHFMILRVINIFDNININETLIKRNVDSIPGSQLSLLDLIQKGHNRQEAYRIVQNK